MILRQFLGLKKYLLARMGDITYIRSMPVFMCETVDELKTEIQNMLEGCNKPMIDYNTGEEVKQHSPPT